MKTVIQKMLKNSYLHTALTCWRELLLFAVLGLGLTAAGGVVDYLAAYFGDSRFIALVLPAITNFLQGFSRFMGACVASGFLYAVLWPVVNKFGNNGFNAAWETLTPAQKLTAYFSILMVALLAAAICFSVR